MIKNNINFSKSLTKNDKILLNFIIRYIGLYNSKKISVTENKLNSMLKISEDSSIDKFLNFFLLKKIIYRYSKFNTINIEGSLTVMESFQKIETTYNINISDTFFEIFNSEFNDFKMYNLNSLLQFSNINTTRFFSFIKNQPLSNNSFEVSVDELKSTLNLSNSYPRFYDFEKNVIIPCLKDIRKVTFLDIKYKKIKFFNKSRIKGIRFLIENKNEAYILDKIEKLLETLETYIKVDENMRNFIISSVKLNGLGYVESNLEYSLLHHNKNFEVFVVNSIKYDYLHKRFSDNIKKYTRTYKNIFSFTGHFNTLNDFVSFIFNELENKKYNHISTLINFMKDYYLSNEKYPSSYNTNFERFLSDLQNRNEGEFEDNKFIILSEYNGNKFLSNISIFIK